MEKSENIPIVAVAANIVSGLNVALEGGEHSCYMVGPAPECSLQISQRGFSEDEILEKAYGIIHSRETYLDQ